MLNEADKVAHLHLKVRDSLMQDPYEKVAVVEISFEIFISQ